MRPSHTSEFDHLRNTVDIVIKEVEKYNGFVLECTNIKTKRMETIYFCNKADKAENLADAQRTASSDYIDAHCAAGGHLSFVGSVSEDFETAQDSGDFQAVDVSELTGSQKEQVSEMENRYPRGAAVVHKNGAVLASLPCIEDAVKLADKWNKGRAA